MASLTALLLDVYKLTKRPDLASQTALAVKAATLKAHQSDFFSKDLFETGLEFDNSLYLQTLEYKALIPRYRALKYLRKYDAVGESAGDFFDIITPEQTLDGYNVNREDVVYLAGAVLNIRSSTEIKYALIGCYLNPDITDQGYASWIADERPFTVIYEAAATVFKGIGFDEQAAAYQRFVADYYMELKQEIATKGE